MLTDGSKQQVHVRNPVQFKSVPCPVHSSVDVVSTSDMKETTNVEAEKSYSSDTNGSKIVFKRWSSSDIDAQITAASKAIAIDGDYFIAYVFYKRSL